MKIVKCKTQYYIELDEPPTAKGGRVYMDEKGDKYIFRGIKKTERPIVLGDWKQTWSAEVEPENISVKTAPKGIVTLIKNEADYNKLRVFLLDQLKNFNWFDSIGIFNDKIVITVNDTPTVDIPNLVDDINIEVKYLYVIGIEEVNRTKHSVGGDVELSSYAKKQLTFDKDPEHKVIRNTSTESSRKFWDSAKQAAVKVRQWPKWKRAGINVSTTRTFSTSLREFDSHNEYQTSLMDVYDPFADADIAFYTNTPCENLTMAASKPKDGPFVLFAWPKDNGRIIAGWVLPEDLFKLEIKEAVLEVAPPGPKNDVLKIILHVIGKTPELEGQITGYWFGPDDNHILTKLPEWDPTGALLPIKDYGNDKFIALSLEYFQSRWSPIHPNSRYSYVHTAGMFRGETWYFISDCGKRYAITFSHETDELLVFNCSLIISEVSMIEAMHKIDATDISMYDVELTPNAQTTCN